MSPATRHPTGSASPSARASSTTSTASACAAALPLTLSMRYLRDARSSGCGAGTAPVDGAAGRRARPPGRSSVTFVGHATVMITTPGSRVLVDPLLENSLFGVRRAKAAGIAAADLADVDLVLVTHAHRDHLSRHSLARLPGAGAACRAAALRAAGAPGRPAEGRGARSGAQLHGRATSR